MTWMDVLEAVRKLSEAGEFTAPDLAKEARIKKGEKSTADQIASAWLGKFCRWGYVIRKGTIPGQKKWIRMYEITKFGREFTPKE